MEIGMGRTEEAQQIISGAQRWSFAAGLCPIPWIDVGAVTYVQLEMIKELCSLYAVPYRESSAKALGAALVGSVLPTALGSSVARAALRHLPGIGPMIAALSMPTTLAGSTTIVGKLVAEHFAGGGDLSNFGLDVRPEPTTVASATPSSPPTQSAPTDDAREVVDDLTEINGVGPKIAELLGAADVHTFAQIAVLSAEELRQILLAGGPRYRSHDPSSWPAQAASLRGV